MAVISSMPSPRSNIPAMLKERYDLDELIIYEQPDNRTVVFDILYLGDRRGFAIDQNLLDQAGEETGTRMICQGIERIVAAINEEVIDLRQNALEGLSDVKILVDRAEEEQPGNAHAIIVTPEQADYLLATSDVRDYIVNGDPNRAFLFGHPFRVKGAPRA